MDTRTETAPDVGELSVAVSAVAAGAECTRVAWRRAVVTVAALAIRAPTVASRAPVVAMTVRACTTHARAARALSAGFTLRASTLRAGSDGDVPGVDLFSVHHKWTMLALEYEGAG